VPLPGAFTCGRALNLPSWTRSALLIAQEGSLEILVRLLSRHFRPGEAGEEIDSGVSGPPVCHSGNIENSKIRFDRTLFQSLRRSHRRGSRPGPSPSSREGKSSPVESRQDKARQGKTKQGSTSYQSLLGKKQKRSLHEAQGPEPSPPEPSPQSLEPRAYGEHGHNPRLPIHTTGSYRSSLRTSHLASLETFLPPSSHLPINLQPLCTRERIE